MALLKTKHLVSLGLGIVLSILVFLLTHISNTKPSYLKEKGFVRKFKSVEVQLINRTILPPNNYHIIGVLRDKVFLKSSRNAAIISIAVLDTVVKLNGSTNSNKSYNLGFHDLNFIGLDTIKGELNIFNSNERCLIIRDASNFREKRRIAFKDDFTRASKAGDYALITTDSAYRYFFKLYKINTNNTVTHIKSMDALPGSSLTEDGTLKSDGKGQFAYVSFYKNTFWLIDTLAQVKACKTIDTIATGPKTALIMNGTRMVYTEPLRLTNSTFHFIAGQLGVESAVASNTAGEHIRYNNVVDFYTKEGKYLYSLSFGGEYQIRPKNVFLQGEFLYVLSGSNLLTYRLRIRK